MSIKNSKDFPKCLKQMPFKMGGNWHSTTNYAGKLFQPLATPFYSTKWYLSLIYLYI